MSLYKVTKILKDFSKKINFSKHVTFKKSL